jgi:hypothetical protein
MDAQDTDGCLVIERMARSALSTFYRLAALLTTLAAKTCPEALWTTNLLGSVASK